MTYQNVTLDNIRLFYYYWVMQIFLFTLLSYISNKERGSYMFLGIDWNKRFKNKYFWLFILAVVLKLFTGFDISIMSDKIIGILDIFLALVAILGVSVDTSTPKISDAKNVTTIANKVKTYLEDTVEVITESFDSEDNNNSS